MYSFDNGYWNSHLIVKNDDIQFMGVVFDAGKTLYESFYLTKEVDTKSLSHCANYGCFPGSTFVHFYQYGARKKSYIADIENKKVYVLGGKYRYFLKNKQ